MVKASLNQALLASEIKQLDQWAIEKIGIPSVVLMENAGRKTAQIITEHLKHKPKSRILVVCGTGNNGGDGFVIARYLWTQGHKVKVFIVGKQRDLKQDARINFQIIKNLKLSYQFITSANDDFLKALKDSTLIVDAIFGFGLNREIGKPFERIIQLINQSKKFTVAVDTPSGLDATSGKIQGACIKANLTVTFTAIKRGFGINHGPDYTGTIKVVDIGIPI